MDFGRRNPFQEGPVQERPPWSPIELFLDENNKITMPNIKAQVLDYSQPMIWAAAGMILFNPIFWNFVARNEYKNKSLTKIFGSPYNGTYFLAFTIFALGIFRDYIYHLGLKTQPSAASLSIPEIKYLGAALIGAGQILVITSIWALGLTGTYLGDYFGILMSHRVTSFPFNIMQDPMYNGSTMCFAGAALWAGKPAGLVLSGLVYVVYQVALAFEGPFTDKIYSAAAAAKKKQDVPVFKPSNPKTLSQPVSSSSQTTAHNAQNGPSYASAVADSSATNSHTLPSVDPSSQQDVDILSTLGNAIGTHPSTPVRGSKFTEEFKREDSPMRVTRSRSRARIVDDD